MFITVSSTVFFNPVVITACKYYTEILEQFGCNMQTIVFNKVSIFGYQLSCENAICSCFGLGSGIEVFYRMFSEIHFVRNVLTYWHIGTLQLNMITRKLFFSNEVSTHLCDSLHICLHFDLFLSLILASCVKFNISILHFYHNKMYHH